MEKPDIEHYRAKGWAVLETAFGPDECAGLVDHMLALQAGAATLEGFAPRAPDEWQRTHNQHWYDPVARDWLIAPPLEGPLRRILDHVRLPPKHIHKL